MSPQVSSLLLIVSISRRSRSQNLYFYDTLPIINTCNIFDFVHFRLLGNVTSIPWWKRRYMYHIFNLLCYRMSSFTHSLWQCEIHKNQELEETEVHFAAKTSVWKHLSSYFPSHYILPTKCCRVSILQLGRASMNPPRLMLEVWGTSAFQAWLLAKLKSPHFKHKSGGFTLARTSYIYIGM